MCKFDRLLSNIFKYNVMFDEYYKVYTNTVL